MTLLRPFYMGEREITNGQFRQFRRTTTPAPSGQYSLDLDKQPVVARHLGRSRRILQLAVGAGRPAAGLPAARGRRLHAHHARHQRLPAAHRGRVGIRGARRRAPASRSSIPGARSCRSCPGTANIGGSRGARVVRRRRRRPPGRIPGGGRARAVRAERARFLRFRRQRVRVGQRPLSVVRAVRRRSPIRSGPNDGKSHTYRGSNWRTVATGELRFPWREGAAEASDVIGFRVARYVAAE